MAEGVALSELVKRLAGKDIRSDYSTDFTTRLVFQKLMYLLQESGSIGDHFYFNYYAHGPYSPEWAREGYSAASGKDRVIGLAKPLAGIQELIALGHSDPTWLTALATVHFYSRSMHLSKVEARARAEADGKSSILDVFDVAWLALESRHWLAT